MSTIRADAEVFEGAMPPDARPAAPPRRQSAALALLAILGLFLGIVAGALLAVASGLVGLC